MRSDSGGVLLQCRDIIAIHYSQSTIRLFQMGTTQVAVRNTGRTWFYSNFVLSCILALTLLGGPAMVFV